MNTTPLLSAIVLNYRSPKFTVRCVQALQAQSIASDMEIFIVDNHSNDESISFLRGQFQHEKNVRIVETKENIGYGRGNNFAASMAKGTYLLIINPDNTMPTDAAEKMICYLKEHPDVGIVGPALIHDDGTVRASARSFPTLKDLFKKRMFPATWAKKFEERRKSMVQQQAVHVDWIVGACLLMQRDFFKSIGGFDEQFFLFFEDIDLCRTTKLQGKKIVYLPKIHVADKKDRLSGLGMFSIFTKKTTRIHLQSAIKYFWKWLWRS